MSKRNNSYGLNLETLPYSIVISALVIIFWGVMNILDIWSPSYEVDVLKSIAYLLIVFAGLTIIIDFMRHNKK